MDLTQVHSPNARWNCLRVVPLEHFSPSFQIMEWAHQLGSQEGEHQYQCQARKIELRRADWTISSPCNRESLTLATRDVVVRILLIVVGIRAQCKRVHVIRLV